MKIIILDAYTDEPACLGVPPFISHYVRYAAGAIIAAGHTPLYLTIDDCRRGTTADEFKKAHAVLIMGGALVPGKYLRSMPASIKEINAMAAQIPGIKILGGPVARFGPKGPKPQQINTEKFDYISVADTDAFIFDLLSGSEPSQRERTMDEWNEWPVLGASIVKQHSDHPVPLTAEIETYRGCIRHSCGGCSFCIEPEYGRPIFRSIEYIVAEVKALSSVGLHNFRLGAQTCFFSYNPDAAKGNYVPNPDAIEKLLSQMRAAAKINVLHIDNANPAVIADNPEAVEDILRSIV
jgi:radical SAM superfamily enzyme with C-terminal helix-hairpin-helix motif